MSALRSYRVAADPALRIHVADLGMACCAMEFAAAVAAGLLIAADADEPGRSGAGTDVLVVSGTVTDRLAPAVGAALARLGPGAQVVSFGACANTGGPYWDSYSVTKGIDQVVEVHRYVPGCPPRPEALVDALLGLALDARDTQPAAATP